MYRRSEYTKVVGNPARAIQKRFDDELIELLLKFKWWDNSPSVEESVLQRAVMAAIMETANQNTEVLRTLKLHIGMGLAGEKSEDNSIDLQIRIAEIDAEFKKMLDRVSTDTIEAFDEETATRLMNKKSRLQQQLDSIADAEQRRENAKTRLDDIYMILDGKEPSDGIR